MAIQSMQLDPNAQSYSDDQIVGKVNAATAQITRANAVNCDALQDGVTNVTYTDIEATKLAGIEAGAEVNPSGADMRDAIVALPDTTRKLIITDPAATEFKVISIERKADGKANIKYDDVPV